MLRLPDFKKIATWRWWGCSPTHRLPLSPAPGTNFWYRLNRPEGHSQWKIPVTPLGIEPATFRPAAHSVPPLTIRIQIINVWKCSHKKCRSVSQYMLGVVYQRFGTTYQFHLQGSRACLVLEEISTHTLHASIHTHTRAHVNRHIRILQHQRGN